MTPFLFPLGAVFGVALTLFVFHARERVTQGRPVLGGVTPARRLPEQPDSELALRRRLRQAAVSRGAEEIMARAASNGQVVSMADAEQAAAAMLDATGFET